MYITPSDFVYDFQEMYFILLSVSCSILGRSFFGLCVCSCLQLLSRQGKISKGLTCV